MKQEREIFKQGSTTYYWSSKFFPKGVRDDVSKLYSFVRLVDDMVDVQPARIDRFKYICKRWRTIKSQLAAGTVPAALDESIEELVLYNIAYVVYRHGCDPAWIDAFLESMDKDARAHVYETIDDTLSYIYGSAEVIGLCMVRIMKLPGQGTKLTHPEPDVMYYARMQGRAMQYINFIRDIAEDNAMNRCYFPQKDITKFGLIDLSEETARTCPEEFGKFIAFQIKRYQKWQAEADKGASYLPRKFRIPVKTASDMYNWTAEQILQDPLVVFSRKVKPTKQQVLAQAAKNSIHV